MSNLQAFLTTIARAEGTAGIGEDGYNVLVGSTKANPRLFYSYRDHPRVLVNVRPGLNSTAAGRYQILERIFDHYRASLDLPDFSPESQDRIAIQLIRECRAFDDVQAGKFHAAIHKVRSRWASLPGAGYQQAERTTSWLRHEFITAGGLVTD